MTIFREDVRAKGRPTTAVQTQATFVLLRFAPRCSGRAGAASRREIQEAIDENRDHDTAGAACAGPDLE